MEKEPGFHGKEETQGGQGQVLGSLDARLHIFVSYGRGICPMGFLSILGFQN